MNISSTYSDTTGTINTRTRSVIRDEDQLIRSALFPNAWASSQKIMIVEIVLLLLIPVIPIMYVDSYHFNGALGQVGLYPSQCIILKEPQEVTDTVVCGTTS